MKSLARLLLVTLTLTALFCVVTSVTSFTSPAGAIEVPEPMETDFVKLEELLAAHPEALDNAPEYETWTAENYQDISRALAYIEELDTGYAGVDAFSGGLTDVFADPQIAADYSALQDGFASLGDAGGVCRAICGQIMDTVVGSGALPLLALISADSYLWYEDITTRTNPISVALFGGQETATEYREHETLESGDVAADHLRWVSFAGMHVEGNDFQHEIETYELEHTLCPGGHPYFTYHPTEGPNCRASEAVDRFGNTIESGVDQYSPYGTSLHGGLGVFFAAPAYYLEVEVSGKWYFGSGYESNPIWLSTEETPSGVMIDTKEHPSILRGWVTGTQWCTANGGRGFNSAVAGYAPGLAEFDLVGQGSGAFCVPGEHADPIVRTAGVLAGKELSHLRHGAAHKITEAESVALCMAHPCQHVSANGIGTEGGPSVKDGTRGIHDRLTGKQDEPLQKAYKHWMETAPEVVRPPGHCYEEVCYKYPEGPPVTPLPGTATIPTCTGIATACQAELEELGFHSIEIDPKTWEHAVVTQPAKAVISLNPAAGSTVETTTTVKIDSNPALMPLVVPSFSPHEVWTTYKDALKTAGFPTPEENVLETPDPEHGPNEIVATAPATGTLVDPGSEPSGEPKVDVNPPTATGPVEGPKGVGPPTLPGFNMPKLGVLCRGFPFGVPCWLWKTIESWSAPGVAPILGIEDFTIMGHKITGRGFDLAKLEPIMSKVRPAMIIFSTIGVLLLFFRLAKGGSPESGSRGDSSVGSTLSPDEGVYL